MKNLQTPGSSAPDSKDQFRTLKAVRQLIKTKAYKNQAIEMLEKVEIEHLPNEGKVLINYIWGRIHILQYKETHDIQDLEIANDFLDYMIVVAYEHKVRVTDPRLHFSRAHTKFLLAHLTWNEQEKPWLLDKARHITNTTLGFYPENSSFIWLQEQLVD